MDRKPIYLESDDEITSVVDKLKNAEGTSLDIVIPKEAIMLQSVINLKLLKKQAEALGKEITIVTQDKVGQKLAEQIGIPVVAKEGQEPHEVNMSENEKPTFSDNDIEVKNVPEEPSTNDVVTPTKEIVEDVAEPKAKKGKGWLRLHKKGALIAAGFGVLALAVAIYVLVPLSNITLRLAAEKKALDLTFTADKTATEVSTDENKIPAREVVQELEKEETYPATGKKDAGEKATGTVTMSNKSGNVQTLVSGTRLEAASGLVYRTTVNVSIPKATVDGGGNIVAGTVDVTVSANLAGEKYNLAPTTFTVPGLSGTPQYALVTGANAAAFTGGSTKVITFILAADIKNAKTKLTETVTTELKTQTSGAIEGGETLLEGAIKIEEVSLAPSAAVGDEVNEFKLKLKLKGTALVFKQDDLLSLAEGVLAQEIGSTKEIVEKDSLISEAKAQKLDIKAGSLTATLAGEAYIATKINQDELKNSINGDPQKVAEDYLNNLEGVDEVQIRFFPGFYKRIPRINAHIYIKTEINKTQTD